MVQVAEALKATGAPSEDTATAIVGAFDATADEVTKTLVEVGYDARDVVEVLLEQFKYKMAQVIERLASTFGLGEVAEAVADVTNAGKGHIAEALRAAGHDAGETAAVLQEVFQASAADVAQALSQAGFDIPQITQVLIDLFNMTAAEVAGLFAQLGIG
jgi:hypothetical protein